MSKQERIVSSSRESKRFGRRIARSALGTTVALALAVAGCGSAGSATTTSRQTAKPKQTLKTPGHIKTDSQIISSAPNTGLRELLPGVNAGSLCLPDIQKLVGALLTRADGSESEGMSCGTAGVNHPPNEFVAQYTGKYEYLVAFEDASAVGGNNNPQEVNFFKARPDLYKLEPPIEGNITYFNPELNCLFVCSSW